MFRWRPLNEGVNSESLQILLSSFLHLYDYVGDCICIFWLFSPRHVSMPVRRFLLFVVNTSKRCDTRTKGSSQGTAPKPRTFHRTPSAHEPSTAIDHEIGPYVEVPKSEKSMFIGGIIVHVVPECKGRRHTRIDSV